MDQIKIGAFIAALRKEQGLTQRQLAEELNISDKTVSKWETGKGLPEVSLMLPLCERLGISVNELLSGERLEQENYEQKAEENMLNLMIDNKKKELKHLKIQCAILTLFTIVFRLPIPDIVLYVIFTALVWGFLLYCGFEFFASIYKRCKGQIDGYQHFILLITWSILFFVGLILRMFVDASFTGTGRLF